MELQPEPGIDSEVQPPVEINSLEFVPVLCGNFGKNHRNTTRLVTSMEDFYKSYFPSVKICGVDVRLSPDLPPTVKHLTRHLLDRPGSRYQQLKYVYEMIQDSLEDDELEQIADELATVPLQLPAPLPE